jgi:hypothetical protein
MANRFGADILIQAQNPKDAALFYVKQLGFEITDDTPNLISLHGEYINLIYRTRSCARAGVGSDR